MISYFDPLYRQSDYVPVVHSYYDRADMQRSTVLRVNHAHSLCEIMYVNEGQMSLETEEGLIQVGRKQFIWLDANVKHWGLNFGDSLCSMMNIEFQYELLDCRAPTLRAISRQDDATQELISHPVPHMVLTDRDDTVYHLMKEIIQLADSTHKQSERLCSLLCTQVMLEVARLFQQRRGALPPITNRYVSDALSIMRRDYAEPLTVAGIAAQLHVQPTYLHRLFREHTAYTMGEHLQRIRVQQAQRLLLHTKDALPEVAAAVGISSPQHFAQLFKRIVGISPAEYRRQGKDDALPPLEFF
ncbi:MAG: AraC family transcriptional regulator [Eubacteriales bacterium]|nr:AraC family transcriptional regulator [Eubacteriales bacterium]